MSEIVEKIVFQVGTWVAHVWV